MSGIDRDVLETQRDVLRDARALHQAALDEAIALEARAMRTEHIAHAQATASAAIEAEAHRQVMTARVMQAEQLRAVRECSADIASIRSVLTDLPDQRQPLTSA
jgi:alanine racemase